MKRTRLSERTLPPYSRAEELFHFISHTVGGGLSVVALAVGVVYAALCSDAWAVVCAAVYGATLILMYAMSSLYHALTHPMAKRVLQVLDHCSIYFLIAGTYTPILLCAVRRQHPTTAWIMFGAVWALCALATTLTAIDLRRFRVFSMICYIGMGWCVVLAAGHVLDSIAPTGLWLLLAGGISYSVGAVLFGIGTRVRFMHAVFHLFVLLGSILHYFCILLFVL